MAAAVAGAIAGDAAATVAAIAAIIAVLSFLTLHAYAPEERIPWLILVVLTILLSPFVPLIYLSWRWARRRPIERRAGSDLLHGL
jgi:hypothetical protein